MANETPKKPIRRVTVPTVPKEVPANGDKKESNAKRNTLLVIFFLVIAVILYLVIFQRPLLSKYFPVFSGNEKSGVVVSDTTAISSDTLSDEEVNTFLGQQNPNAIVYPEGSHFYLVAGTFIFYPYAEKFRDKMTGEGYEAGIVSSGTPRQFHRVYILASEDPAEIRAKRDELRSTHNMDVWLYAE